PLAEAVEQAEGDAAVPDHGEVQHRQQHDLADIRQVDDVENPPFAELVEGDDDQGGQDAEQRQLVAGHRSPHQGMHGRVTPGYAGKVVSVTPRPGTPAPSSPRQRTGRTAWGGSAACRLPPTRASSGRTWPRAPA